MKSFLTRAFAISLLAVLTALPARAAFVTERSFFARLPTVRDETRWLDGHPDTHAIVARRKGDTWFIGALNGSAARDFRVSLAVTHAAEVPKPEISIQGAGFSLAASHPGKLYVVSSKPLSLQSAQGCKASITLAGDNLWCVTLNDRLRHTPNVIHLK